MTRIGLLLDVPAHGGGTFQYGQMMLAALLSLPQDEYQVVVVHTRADWSAVLAGTAAEVHRVDVPWLARLLQRAWNSLSLPAWPWRRWLHRVHPLPRTLVGLECDAWIFPAQDLWGIWTPVVAINTVHDLMHRYEPGFPEVGRADIRWRRERLHRAICRYSRVILVDSDLGGTHVTESYAPAEASIRVLPYAVPPAIAAAGDTAPPHPARYRLPGKYLFYPAQFWKHKNHENLLRAVAMLRPALPDIALVLVGAPKNAAADVIALIGELGLDDCIRRLGYVPEQDMPALYRHARAMVMPSFFGPTNIPALEAMALGCPVAVSGIYAVPEQLGDAALYFDPSSVDSIAAAIRALWTDDALVATLRSRHAEVAFRHSAAAFAARVEAILEDIR